MGAFDNASFEEISAILGQGDTTAVSEGAWQWTSMQRSLQELATVLTSQRVSLLRDSGWSGPSADQFDSYMTAMTQQINAMADSAGTISTQLYNAQEALSTARAYLPAKPSQNLNFSDPTPQRWYLYSPGYGDPASGPTAAPGGKAPYIDGTAQDYYNGITEIARDQANNVATSYDAAAKSLAQSQAAAPTASGPAYNTGNQPGTSGVAGSRTSAVGSRVGTPADKPGADTSAARLTPQGSGAVPSSKETPGGNRAAGGDVVPEGSGAPYGAGRSPNIGGGSGPGSTGTHSTNDGLGNWLPGGVPEGGIPGGTSGPGGATPRRGSGPGNRSGAGDTTSGFGDGSDGVWGGTRVPSSVAGRGGVLRPARPLGEVEPGIIGGEPVGGGRVIGGRGVPGESGSAGDGVSGGRLEASPPEETTARRWPRAGGVMESEPHSGGYPGGMPMGGSGSGRENERGKRPKYLKQDPEYWQSKKDVVPPVIE